MATFTRRPLSNRSIPLHLPSTLPQGHSPSKATRTVSGASKRGRSPEPPDDSATSLPVSKRVKPVTTSLAPSTTRDISKERKHAEREAEFRDKYSRAFPQWTFYFDLANVEPDQGYLQHLQHQIHILGGSIEDFFSADITHLITNQPNPVVQPADHATDKENNPRLRQTVKPGPGLKSPIKLKGRGPADDAVPTFDLVSKAAQFNKKIWSTSKLASVLSRCIDPDTPHAGLRPAETHSTAGSQRSLSRLLQSERIHGTTERDPTQKRHDYTYFSKASYFLLIEDMRQEYAPIMVHEYPIPKGPDAVPKYPVLHCHPNSRGPFIAYDEKEKRRWEKTQKAELEQQEQQNELISAKMSQIEAVKRKADAQLHAARTGDLRRSVSMNNLHRRATHPHTGVPSQLQEVPTVGDGSESTHPSGYLASGYIAASGNSVAITSTAGTTSTTEYSFTNSKLPSALTGRIKQQVLTSRKFPPVNDRVEETSTSVMGPPLAIPKRTALLRKSKSTNSLKLTKRDETVKFGYCESCRTKFDDFKAHVVSRKHRKFAADDANFLQLDCVLARVHRRTRQQVKEEERQRDAYRSRHRTSHDSEDENWPSLSTPPDDRVSSPSPISSWDCDETMQSAQSQWTGL